MKLGLKSKFLPLVLILLFPLSPVSVSGDEHYLVTTTLLSVSNTPLLHHVEPSMAILEDGTIFAGWKEAYTHDGGGIAVSYVYSEDGGSSWSNPEFIPSTFSGEPNNLGRPSFQSDPWMRSFGNTLYFSYLEFNSTDSQITMAKTSDLGQSWDQVKATNNTGFADKETFDIDDNGTIYLVYDDVTESGTAVRLSHSYDGGKTFLEDGIISDQEVGDHVGPYIESVGGTNLYVAFTSFPRNGNPGDIIFDKSIDNGKTWGVDSDINPDYNGSIFTRNQESNRPMKVSLPVLDHSDGGRLYLAWDDVSIDDTKMNWDVYFRFTDDQGESWSDPIRINAVTDRSQWMPELAVGTDDRVHFIYYDQVSAERIDLKYRIWDPQSLTFNEELILSDTSISTDFTRLGEYTTMEFDENGVLHLVWTTSDGTHLDINYSQLEDSNMTSSTAGLSLGWTVLIPYGFIVRFGKGRDI